MKKPKHVTFLMGKGSVSVGLTSILGFGTYQLQELKNPGKIDRTPSEKEIDPKAPTVTVFFMNEDAVTREIKRLQRLRRMMRKTGACPVEIVKDPGPKCGAL